MPLMKYGTPLIIHMYLFLLLFKENAAKGMLRSQQALNVKDTSSPMVQIVVYPPCTCSCGCDEGQTGADTCDCPPTSATASTLSSESPAAASYNFHFSDEATLRLKNILGAEFSTIQDRNEAIKKESCLQEESRNTAENTITYRVDFVGDSERGRVSESDCLDDADVYGNMLRSINAPEGQNQVTHFHEAQIEAGTQEPIGVIDADGVKSSKGGVGEVEQREEEGEGGGRGHLLDGSNTDGSNGDNASLRPTSSSRHGVGGGEVDTELKGGKLYKSTMENVQVVPGNSGGTDDGPDTNYLTSARSRLRGTGRGIDGLP